VRKKQNYNEIKILPNNKGLFVLNRGIEYEYSEVESIEYYNSNGNLIKKIDRVGSVDNLENIWISPNMNHFFISPCQNIMYGDFGEGFYNDFIRIYSFDNNDSAVHKIENPKYLSKAKYGFISNYFYAIFNYDKFKCKSFLLLFDKNGKCILSKSYIEIISIEEIKKFIGKEKL
jgi:hypothetical protein